ncbi:HAMP domain-containing protein [Lysinibacillus sp. MHQ-1]|nr:HAMP domain-containing protein [Lysinibacillus sp. MHQ-1]
MDSYAKELNTFNDAFNKSATDALTLFEAGDLEGALLKVNGEVQQANKGIQDISNKIANYQKGQLEKVTLESKQAVFNSQIISIIAIIIGVALGIILMVYIQRTISRPLKSVVHAANQIAIGELHHQDVTHHTKDEIGQLSTAFNSMKGNLKKFINPYSRQC